MLERYWNEHAQFGKSPRDLRQHIDQILSVLNPNTRYVEIGIADVQAFLVARRQIGKLVWSAKHKALVRKGDISDGTLANILTTWQAAHNHALEVSELPVKHIAWKRIKPQRSTGRISSITQEQAHDLFARLPPPTQALIIFILATGCRSAQATDLTYDRVDFAGRTVKVQKQKRKGQDWETKPLNDQALAAIGMAQAHGIPRSLTGPVFDITNFRNRWVEARNAVGLPQFNVHDLRHTFATWLGKAGTPVQIISKLLGHSSVSVTMRYLEVCNSQAAAAVNTFPSLRIVGAPMQEGKIVDANEEHGGTPKLETPTKKSA